MEPKIYTKSEFTVSSEVASNDLIMEEIIKYLDLPGLKNFRRVCPDWYRKSIKAWNEKGFVQIGQPKENPPKDGETTGRSPQNFVKFFKETCDQNFCNFLGIQPFQNFSLSSGEIRSWEKQEKEEIMRNLWKEFQHLASYLQIKIHTENHCLNPILRELGPNVTTLEVIHGDVKIPDFTKVLLEGTSHTQVKRLEISVSAFTRFNFLGKFPNLEELKLYSLRSPSKYGADTIFFTLRTFRFSKTRGNICDLKHLDLIEISAQDLTCFVEVNLPLNYLTLRLDGGDDLSEFLRCMEHYSKSLKTLKIRVTTSKWKVHTPAGFPSKIDFGNLQVLELWGYLTDNLSFLKGAPHLRKMRLDLLCNEARRNFSSTDLEPFSTDSVRNIVENSRDILDQPGFQLLELQELMIDFQLPEDSWKVLRRWMPNLRILEAPLDNINFRLVCGQWPKLRDLVCRFGSDIDDNGLVGEREDDGVNVSGQRTILHLKYLECFELEAPCGQGKITDRSAEFGFLQMSYLRKLKALVSPHLVNEEMEMQLRARIGHVEILRKCRNENVPLKPSGNTICCNWAAERSQL